MQFSRGSAPVAEIKMSISMNKIYSKKHSQIKKQFIAQKLLHLLEKNKYVLFLHQSGATTFHFEKFKQEISQDLALDSLLLPSKISRYSCLRENSRPSGEQQFAFFRDQKTILIQGGALLVACSSFSQCSAVLEKCRGPDLICLGGFFPGMRFSSYLEIQRCVELHKNSAQVYASLFSPLVGWHNMFFALENKGDLIPWASWLLTNKLFSLLESQSGTLKSGAVR